MHGDDARGHGDHRRRRARIRRQGTRGDALLDFFDAREYGHLVAALWTQMVAGKGSGDEVVRRRSTDYGGVYGYAAI